MNDTQPIYKQIMEIIENDIINGTYQANDIIISTTQIAKLYCVNPTTAVKAMSKLTEENILYKKAGIGMCVTEQAYDQLITRRKNSFFKEKLKDVIYEAKTLNITIDEIIDILKGVKNDNT